MIILGQGSSKTTFGAKKVTFGYRLKKWREEERGEVFSQLVLIGSSVEEDFSPEFVKVIGSD